MAVVDPIWKDYCVMVSRKRKTSIQNIGFITFFAAIVTFSKKF